MFENLTEKLSHTLRSITGKAKLSEENIQDRIAFGGVKEIHNFITN